MSHARNQQASGENPTCGLTRSLGNLGPAVTPYLNGLILKSTGSNAYGLYMILVMYLLAGILLARLNEFVRRPAVRIASGMLVLGFGIYGLIGLMRLLHWI